MASRSEHARATATGLRAFADQIADVPVLIGFDGFVDSIIQVVDQRRNDHEYQPIPTIDQFGQRISAAAGKSANFEMVKTLEKLGGNGPIMANALAAAGFDVTYLGCTGYPNLHPAFDRLAKRANVIGIADPGATDALEFNDGKLMLGKYDHVLRINWSDIASSVGETQFASLARQSRLIGTINWTMMPHIESIWQKLKQEVLDAGSDNYLFIDLSDPQKHTAGAIRAAVELGASLRDAARVVLGMNLKESNQVAAALGLSVPDQPESAIEQTAAAIREKLDLHAVVIHPRKGAAAARKVKGAVETASFVGPFVTKPKLSTGAGDNFNAGFCLGLLADLSLVQCLCAGTATSGFYVREAHSPQLAELADFCDHLPDPATPDPEAHVL